MTPKLSTLWCQLEDMFQLIVTPQGIEKVMIQLKDTPTKVYAIGAELFLSKVPLEVLQNWVLIQLIVTPHILRKVQGQIKEVCQLIEPCLLIGTREYVILCSVITLRKFQMIVGKTVRFPKLSCWHHWKADVKLDHLEK